MFVSSDQYPSHLCESFFPLYINHFTHLYINQFSLLNQSFHPFLQQSLLPSKSIIPPLSTSIIAPFQINHFPFNINHFSLLDKSFHSLLIIHFTPIQNNHIVPSKSILLYLLYQSYLPSFQSFSPFHINHQKMIDRKGRMTDIEGKEVFRRRNFEPL